MIMKIIEYYPTLIIKFNFCNVPYLHFWFRPVLRKFPEEMTEKK